jgi:hypothetical protein
MGGMIVAGLLALPAGAAAKQSGPVAGVAAQQCAQERATVGRRAFRKRYGAKHTMRNCVRRNRAKAASTLNSAADECQQELAQLGPEEFILDYAWDEETIENAMSECISDTVDEALDPDDSSDDTDDEE